MMTNRVLMRGGGKACVHRQTCPENAREPGPHRHVDFQANELNSRNPVHMQMQAPAVCVRSPEVYPTTCATCTLVPTITRQISPHASSL